MEPLLLRTSLGRHLRINPRRQTRSPNKSHPVPGDQAATGHTPPGIQGWIQRTRTAPAHAWKRVVPSRPTQQSDIDAVSGVEQAARPTRRGAEKTLPHRPQNRSQRRRREEPGPRGTRASSHQWVVRPRAPRKHMHARTHDPPGARRLSRLGTRQDHRALDPRRKKLLSDSAVCGRAGVVG